MQQVEKGVLKLDGDVSGLLPDFPWQGRRVTVRQLMDMTSGLPSFHLLGDPIRARRGVPKARDEVTALFAGRPFMHEPGARFELTISGFHIAGMLLERVAGQPFPDYLREHIFGRAGLTRSFFCDDRAVTAGLARSYDVLRGVFLNYPLESATLYPYTASVCMSAGDAASLMRALRDGRLLQAESYRAMTTAVGIPSQTRQEPRAVGLTTGQLGQEKSHRWVGGHPYPLMGFNSSLMDFPDDDVTIAVLSNGGRSYVTSPIARNLARAVLGLPLAPPRQLRPEEPQPTEEFPLASAERARYFGMYQTKWSGNADYPHRHWQRTFRVFEENDRLMIQALGEAPEPLLRTGEHTFTIASWATRIVFTLREGRAVSVSLQESDDLGVSGPRVDEPWPNTPRAQN